jgi:hypothetical protein
LKDFKLYNKLIEIVKELLLSKDMELDYIVLSLDQTEANRIAGQVYFSECAEIARGISEVIERSKSVQMLMNQVPGL